MELTRQQALDLIDTKVKACNKCPDLCNTRKHTVFGEGNPSADVVFIGEGPGETEDDTGRPFVGPAGRLLDKIIAACGWKREDVFILNVVKCRPPRNRVPTPEEAANCRQFLRLQLRAIQPKVIVCLGATAARYILGREGSMGDFRGCWHEYKDGPLECKVRCTYHPSYILHIEDKDRKNQEKAKIWRDLQPVIEEVKK